MRFMIAIFGALLTFISVLGGEPNDWPSWRGPNQDGSVETEGLISQWTKNGENMIWHADFTGRSTPVVFGGHVYAFGRSGEGVDMAERVAAFDAKTGKLLWDATVPVYDTAVPFKRVAWSSPAVDPETGNVYIASAGALALCYDKDGKLIWSRNLTQEFGAITGYGGRTVTPILDEDIAIFAYVSSSWGPYVLPKERFFAFEKKTGIIRYITSPGGVFKTPNIYSSPVVAEINGVRQLISGNADGNIYGYKVRTGEMIWQFDLSQRGMNASVAVDGNYVYASHGEENLDQPYLGRVVCIDATGTGDVTKTHEVWRVDKIEAGYTVPLIHEGRVYVVENSANMHCLNAKTGETHWTYSLGTVGKGSPVFADGKIYATETNGRFHILKPGDDGAQELDNDYLTVPDGRYAEIYASPVIAYGRIYFPTEEGMYCIGDPKIPFQINSSSIQMPSPKKDTKPAALLVVPGEVTLGPGSDPVQYQARAYDEHGNFIGLVSPKWSLKGLDGEIGSDGRFTTAAKTRAGLVVAEYEGLTAEGRVRTFPALPWNEDFENIAQDKPASYWVRAGSIRSSASKFYVTKDGENNVLIKPKSDKGLRSNLYMGPSDSSGYVIQADVKGIPRKRFRPDIGLLSHGYTLNLLGNHQRLTIFNWISEIPRLNVTKSFRWDLETWYTMKLRVDYEEGKAIIRGKVWPKDQPEPDAWTITAEDPHPITEGSPGLYGHATADIYYDNVLITEKK